VQGLIVDQTIEKVSFCAPDRNSERGFAYICRDGTSRRWICHCFFTLKETVNVIFLLASPKMTSKVSQMSLCPYDVNIFKTLRLRDCWTDVDETRSAHSVAHDTKPVGGGILNFGRCTTWVHPELSPVGR